MGNASLIHSFKIIISQLHARGSRWPCLTIVSTSPRFLDSNFWIFDKKTGGRWHDDEAIWFLIHVFFIVRGINKRWENDGYYSLENCLQRISAMVVTTGCSFWRMRSSSRNDMWMSIILSMQGNIRSTTSLDKLRYLYIPSTKIWGFFRKHKLLVKHPN